jgi:thiol-disulfide isomerase/thioredoxin
MNHPNNQRGIAGTVVVGGLAVVIVGALIVYAIMSTGKFTMTEQEAMKAQDEATAEKTGEVMMEDAAEAMMKQEESDGTMMEEEQTAAALQFTGTVLAGSSSPLLEYTTADYNAALRSDRLVVLYFYANWCPDCRAEFPLMQQAFDQLTSGRAVGFRVNFNDSDTETAEAELARTFGVPYQHTKVLVKDGQQLLKSPEAWDTSRYLREINNAR